jgi:hypothetical protein
MSHASTIDRLEDRIAAVRASLAQLGAPTEWEELVVIMHRPGWTTLAELLFAETMLEHMSRELAALGALKTQLLKASAAVAPAQQPAHL